MKRKASFTLLEVLLCIALVAFSLSVLTLSLPKFLAGERFEKEVRLVEEKLALVQELCIDQETEVRLVIDEKQLAIVAELPKRWIRTPKPFKEIQSVVFEGERAKRLELVFDGEIGGCPRGELILEGKKKTRTLYLSGYPGKIKRGKEALYGQNAPYPQEMLSHT